MSVVKAALSAIGLCLLLAFVVAGTYVFLAAIFAAHSVGSAYASGWPNA